MDPGAVALVVDLAKASERELRVLRGSFAHQGRVRFEGCDADPLQTTTAVLPGSKRLVLLLRGVMQDAMGGSAQGVHVTEPEGVRR